MAERVRVLKDCGVDPDSGEVLPEVTKQSFKDECDINVIMRQYTQTGVLPAPVREAWYGDFSNVGDFQDCQNRVGAAVAAFEALPAEVRAHFENDPAEIVAAFEDPSRVDELVKLGIMPAPASEPVEVMKSGEGNSDDDSRNRGGSPKRQDDAGTGGDEKGAGADGGKGRKTAAES